MAQQKKHDTASQVLGVIAAVALGAYFLYGTKEGEQKRKKIKGWMLKMKGEILEKVEQAKNIDEEKYTKLVDKTAEKYKKKLKEAEAKEVERLKKDLKRHWNAIKKDLLN